MYHTRITETELLVRLRFCLSLRIHNALFTVYRNISNMELNNISAQNRYCIPIDIQRLGNFTRGLRKIQLLKTFPSLDGLTC